MPDTEVFIKMAAYSQVIPRKKSKDLSKDALKKADSDGNGFLDAEECCKYLKEHKINYSRKHVEFMMKMANNEDLQNNEKEIEGKNVKSKEILAFGLIDKNKDESISKHEMSNMFQRMTKEQVAALFKKIDRDGNGKIDWTEFKQMYSQN